MPWKEFFSGLFFYHFLVLLDKCGHLYICIGLKQTLSHGQKPVLISEQLALTTMFLLWTSLCFLKVNQKKCVGMVSTNNI